MMALTVRKPVEFFKAGCDMTHFIRLINNMIESNWLHRSHVIRNSSSLVDYLVFAYKYITKQLDQSNM